MKALVKYALGSESVELQDLPEPSPREGELKVRVLAASICNSDIHAIHDAREIRMPLVMGHEYVGQVVETCGDVGDFKVGDWVLTIPACYNCGTCELCRAGAPTLCPDHRSIGVMAPGAMADYVIVPAAFSFHVPANATTPEDLIPYALTEPMACLVRGVYERIDVKPGDMVVVSGPGAMGLMGVQAFKAKGAFVILSGLPADAEKLELGKNFGADVTVTSLEELKEAVFSRDPYGAAITCDATGVIPSLNNCMEVIRFWGTHLEVGMFAGTYPFRMDSIFEREATYVPTNASTTTAWDITLDLLAQGKLDLAPLVSRQYPLEQWKDALDAVERKEVYKAVLMPNDLSLFTWS